MNFNLFGLFGQKNAAKDVANPAREANPQNIKPPINLGQIVLSMTDEEAKASWEKHEAQENRKARRFQIGMAIYETYPEMDRDDRHDYEREITKLVMNSEEQTKLVISQIREKKQSPEQILEDLKKNMMVDNAVGVNNPAPEPQNIKPPINLGAIYASLTEEQVKAAWETHEANEKYSQRRYMIGVALCEAYPDINDKQKSILKREFAEILPDENATRVVISKIKSKKQSPEQILEDLKKNMMVGNVVGGNAPAP